MGQLFWYKFLKENKTATLLIFYERNAYFKLTIQKQRYKPTQIEINVQPCIT
jgi:hypothetical protein